jgi:hypothetical protein
MSTHERQIPLADPGGVQFRLYEFGGIRIEREQQNAARAPVQAVYAVYLPADNLVADDVIHRLLISRPAAMDDHPSGFCDRDQTIVTVQDDHVRCVRHRALVYLVRPILMKGSPRGAGIKTVVP